MPKRVITGGILLTAAGLLAWVLALPHDWQTWLGFTQRDYFTAGQNYAFFSGVGPMLLTGLGMSTIIGGLWHAHNCHYDGCWNIGRHKVNGTPWCSLHHLTARPAETDGQKLDRIIALLERIDGNRPGSST